MLQAIAPVFEPAKRAFKDWHSVVALHHLKQSGYAPHVPLQIERENFLIRTVSCPQDLQRAFKLRYQVFHAEYQSPPSIFQMDIDSYDFICDHLVIEDRKSGRIIATYRLICSLFSNRYYSQDEFDLTELLKLPGVKLELGRACISPEFRNGAVMSMLWRGISQYVREVKASYLFGCSSVKTTDLCEIASLNHAFKERGVHCEEVAVLPRGKFRIPGLEMIRVKKFCPPSLVSLPPLLESYFRAGAEVGLEPALDLDFNCVDFFTLLRTDRMNPTHERRYSI